MHTCTCTHAYVSLLDFLGATRRLLHSFHFLFFLFRGSFLLFFGGSFGVLLFCRSFYGFFFLFPGSSLGSGGKRGNLRAERVGAFYGRGIQWCLCMCVCGWFWLVTLSLCVRACHVRMCMYVSVSKYCTCVLCIHVYLNTYVIHFQEIHTYTHTHTHKHIVLYYMQQISRNSHTSVFKIVNR